MDDRDEIPIHPLDLSTPPGSDAPDPNSCIGLIQTSADATLRNPTSVVGDMVLGVAFLRNVYTVLAYDVPASNGSFPTLSLNSTVVRPRLGLLGLTDPTVALDEFHRVRVLNQPLSDANPTGSSTDAGGARKPSVGIDVLIALGGFVGLCLLLFGLRWVFVRRSLRRGTDGDENLSARDAKSRDHFALALGRYQLAQRGPGADDGLPTEDELRQRRYDAYMHSLHTVSTDRTQFEPILDDGGTPVKDGAVKFPHAEPVQQLGQEQELPASPLPPVSPRDHSPLLAEHPPDLRHGRVLSVNLPLLPDAGPGTEEGTMAGVGAAFARGRSVSQRLSTTTSVSRSPAPEP